MLWTFILKLNYMMRYFPLRDHNAKLVVGEVFEYMLAQPVDGKSIGLGVLTDNKFLHPLCLSKENNCELVYDYHREPLPLSSVKSMCVVDGIFPSQRIVEDRISNPHGEHAEDVFLIDQLNKERFYLPLSEENHM